MQFNNHYKLAGQHAFLRASDPSWLRYDEDKLDARWFSAQAAALGTRKHNLAAELIRMKVRLEDNDQTLNRYVNDCIGWQMTPEQVLYVSDNAFGTADAIDFNDVKKVLRISDLKTGITRTSMDQLYIYAAFFCIEYNHNPFKISIELRIYQDDDVKFEEGDPQVVMQIIDIIHHFDRRIDEMKMAALG